ncbi:MAG TPA: hypothetical protein VH061_05385 [Solirubrobacteraceae bacterium]|jgi:hypothetical protein|nr:hypothetical protein [Solirubrobacteraceae bacterium]
MTQHDNLTLILRQLRESFAQIAERPERGGVSSPAIAGPHLLDRDQAASAHVIDGLVTRDPHDPGEERHLSFLVPADRSHQLRKHLLRNVFCLVLVAHETTDIAVHVIRIAGIQKSERLAITRLCLPDRCGHPWR